MYNVHTEMPMGNRSKGFDFEDRDKAESAFHRVVDQIRAWPNITIKVILHHEGVAVLGAKFDPYETVVWRF